MGRIIGVKSKNKKGSLQDLFLVGGIIVFFAIATLIGFKVTTEWTDHTASMSNIPTSAKEANTELVGHFTGVLDTSFLLALTFLCIGVLVLAALVRVHPVFIPIFIIALVFLIFFSAVLSNIYQEMAETTSLSTEASQLTMISNIIANLPIIIGVMGSIVLIVMYKNWKET